MSHANNDTTTNQRILVADDDPVSRRVLASLLPKWNYDVIVASDGHEALRILENEDAPRLALLDWVMPGIEGTEICRRVRERQERPYIYVLLLTGRKQKGDLVKGLELGADDYLTKPFDADELRARLHVGRRILRLQDRLIVAQMELRFKATHDSLTGLANRGMALDAINREFARQFREGGSVGVILLDLDHFKDVNDSLGHLAGDAVLSGVAQRLLASARTYDLVSRYGGEEFLIVVPSADTLAALALAERMRIAIEGQPFPTTVGDVRVTASFGVAASAPSRVVTPEALLRWADEALYLAKQRGRNRSEVSANGNLPIWLSRGSAKVPA